MKKSEYKEPIFKVVNSSFEDVLTSSWDPQYNQGQFETNPQPFVGF